MAEWTRETPWRQGHLLSAEAIGALHLGCAKLPGETIAIIASHDCDVAQDPEGEPRVEVIVGRVITAEDKDGNYTHAKNARKLHLEFEGEASTWVEIEAISKIAVEKTNLSPFVPKANAYLSPESRATFQMWLASRYRRSAFPDEFERRLSKETKLAEKIAKAVKPHGDLIAGIFFDVDNGEEVARNGADDTYTLDITILHINNSDFQIAEAAANEVAQTIEKAFKDKLFEPTKTWQNIELRSCEPVSESALSYQVFKQLKRWRLEHLSLAAGLQHPVLAE